MPGKVSPPSSTEANASAWALPTWNNPTAVATLTNRVCGSLRVVAEGVEDQTNWQELNALGCDAIQGYYTGKPMPADDLTQWLHQVREPTSAAATRPRAARLAVGRSGESSGTSGSAPGCSPTPR